jgi:hypothetical protein
MMIAAVLGLAAMPVPTSAQAFDPARIVAAVEQVDLVALATSLEHTVVEQGAADEPFVVARSRDNVSYVLLGTACGVNGAPGCQGVMMQVRLALPPEVTPDRLARANAAQAAVTAWADFDAKVLLFHRYVVLDEGVTMANIRANVNVLLTVVPEAYAIVSGAQ